MSGEWKTAPLEDLVDDILDRRGVTPPQTCLQTSPLRVTE